MSHYFNYTILITLSVSHISINININKFLVVYIFILIKEKIEILLSHITLSILYYHQFTIKSYKMSSEQMNVVECPICMETIEGVCNRVITECGHNFHCSCLMKNTAHNGFGCPYCRAKMADEPEEDDEDDDESIEEISIFDDDALTSFRMFHQRINGEEVEEEEPDEDWSTVDGESERGEEEETESEPMPDAAYVAKKLTERGITIEDLVKNILFQEHSNYGENYNDYERRSSEVYGQFRAIISQYSPTPYIPLTATHPGSQD